MLTSKSKNSIILCENVYRRRKWRRRQCGGTAINFIKFKKLWNIQFFNLKRMWDRRKSISASSTWFSSTKFLFHFISTTSIHIFCFRSLLIFFHCCCYSYTISIQILYIFIFLHCLHRCRHRASIELTSSTAAKKQQQQSCRERKFLSSVFSPAQQMMATLT